MNIVVWWSSLKHALITCALILVHLRLGSTLPKIPLAAPIINFVPNLVSEPYSITYSLIYPKSIKPDFLRNHEERDVFL